MEAVNQEMGSVYEEIDSENYIDITLGINARYLIEGLERTELDEVQIYMQVLSGSNISITLPQ